MTLEIQPLTGSDIGRYINALAHLRIEVFRSVPYLYDGDRVVGVATGIS